MRNVSRKIIRVCAASAAVAAVLVSATAAATWFAVDWDSSGSESYPGGVVLRDSSGEVVRVSLGRGDVDCRPWYRADGDDWIVKATVASEDGEFWNHGGVRLSSILRAAFQNVAGRRRVSGASTISMQTVRLIRPHEKGYWQKWLEVIRAVKMERVRDKNWIISQYLNRAPFGSNLVGVESAAQGWFGKSARSLGIGEAAMLAGIVQAPSRFRPDRHFDKALKRRDYVIGRMERLGFITSEEAQGARSVVPRIQRAKRPFAHPFYCDWYMKSVPRKGDGGRSGSGDFTMPLDPDIQAACERAVSEASAAAGCHAAAAVVRVATGELVALSVSGDYLRGGTGSQVNAATARRPAGSTLKPILAAQAMDLRLAGPSTLLADTPLAVKGYRPSNFDGRYRGDVSLSDSLVLSLNIPFVRLCRKIGPGRFAGKLAEFGLDPGENAQGRLGLGMAIGTSEVSLVELVSAYARMARAAGGGGGPVSQAAAYLVTEALSGTERSAAALGHVADVEVPRFAWKTGTSSAYRDAWTVMWNPEYAIGVWCGHLAGHFGDRGIVGARAAAPYAWAIARSLYPDNSSAWFARPASAAGLAASAPRVFADEADALAIMFPEDGARYVPAGGAASQRLVCRVSGNVPGRKLWWFLDGAPAGESAGSGELTIEAGKGRHTIVCSTEDGVCSSSSFVIGPPPGSRKARSRQACAGRARNGIQAAASRSATARRSFR